MLVIPVALLILLGALDFGRAFLGWVVLNNAARVGANYAALHPDAWGDPGVAYQQAEYTSLVTEARSDAGIALTGCDTAAVTNPSFPGGTSLGDYAVVQLDCEFDPITPLIGEVLTGVTGGRLAVGARSVFPIREDGIAVAPPSNPPSCLSKIGNPDIDGMDVQFYDETTDSTAWFWVVEGPTAYVSQHPFHTYVTPGTYTVTLDADVSGVDCAQDQITLSVAPTPSPDPDATPTPEASATPTPAPTASPTPRLCTVPGLVGEKRNNAQDLWDAEGFLTTVAIVDGAKPGNWDIEYQSLNSGNDVACNVTIEIGPDPVATNP